MFETNCKNPLEQGEFHEFSCLRAKNGEFSGGSLLQNDMHFGVYPL